MFFKYYASDALAERLICNPHYRSYFNRASAISLQLTLDEFNPYRHLPQAEQNIIFTFLCDASVDMFCKWVEDGKQIPLTGTELSLLEMLARSAGSPVPKADIYPRILGRPMGRYDRAIDVHISAIRHKLAQEGVEDIAIESVRGVGYQLVRLS